MKSKHRVTLFGSSLPDRSDQQGPRFRLKISGFIFIIAGILLLFNTSGILSWNIWHIIWGFWPFLLIIWGLQMIVGRNGVGQFLITVFTIPLFCIVIMFAIHEVNPLFLPGLPLGFYRFFYLMKGNQ